ncbi:2-hydroxy-3-keto-5-methylthiopentenyl-1-phosphate phosphatase [Marinicrinis sediminis]|uniref:2-hydroxy-3-keto-5-methylthiopentenyl-1-phosphate phosphatase n=1 Tax=Marinicrinis sediminis TaxID=1652465 RepID=A0ABW5RD46_9BACL
MNTHKKPVIFCDFDGTITENDNIIAIMKHFQPAGWEQIVEKIMNKEISIRQGVGDLFALLPSEKKQDIVTFAIEQARIRDGFEALLQYCQQEEISFYVTSGGIDFFVYPLLAPYPIEKEHIFCNGSSFEGETIQITWPHACDAHCTNDCGMCKTKIMRSFDQAAYDRILIGDSITDFAGAKLADLVFARSYLKTQCEKEGIPYIAYEDFHTVVEALKTRKASASVKPSV